MADKDLQSGGQIGGGQSGKGSEPGILPGGEKFAEKPEKSETTTTIYWYSTTGNCLSVARELAGKLGAAIYPMAPLLNAVEVECLTDRVGLVFPVYWLGVPTLVKRFIEKLKVKQGAYVFCVSTYGQMNGFALKQAGELLAARGIELSSGLKVQMPDNYQVLLPPTPEDMQKTILARALTVVENYAVDVGRLSRAAVPGTNRGFLGKVKEFFQRIIHNIFEPHEMIWGKLLHAESTCTSCGICERICPARNIRMVEPVTHATGGASKAKPMWGDKCLMCLACLHWCPAQAVQHSFMTKRWGRYHHPQIKSKDLILQEAKPVEK